MSYPPKSAYRKNPSWLAVAVIAILIAMGTLGILSILGCSSLPKAKKTATPPKASSPAASDKSSPIPTATVVVAGVAATGGGVAACLAGAPAIGIPVAGAGVAVMVLGLTIAKFGAWIAGMGALLLLGLVVIFLASRLKKYKASFVDVVTTVQAAKAKLESSFGKEAREQFSQVLGDQDAATQSLVKETKVKENIA